MSEKYRRKGAELFDRIIGQDWAYYNFTHCQSKGLGPGGFGQALEFYFIFYIFVTFRLVYVHKGMSVQNMEPSAEQYRLASMLDANTTADQEKETEQKIQKVVEFTGCNNDKVGRH